MPIGLPVPIPGVPATSGGYGQYVTPLALGAGAQPRIQAYYNRGIAGQLGSGPIIDASAVEVPRVNPLGGALANSPVAPTGGSAVSPWGAPGGTALDPASDFTVSPYTSRVVGEAAPLGRITGFLARQPGANWGVNANNAEAFMPAIEGESALAQAFRPGTIGRGLGYAIAGQIGSGLIRSAFGGEKDGNVDNFLEDAASYGGTGAGIGSLVPGVGTALGGAAGVGVAAVKDFLFGGESNNSAATQAAHEVVKQDKQLTQLLTTAGLSPEAARQIRLEILTSNTGVTDKAQIAANYQLALQQIPAIAQQEQAQRGQLTGLLATQQMISPQFDSYLANLGADSKALGAANNAYADQLSTINPAFGGYLKQASARGILSDAATAAAYKSQLGSQVTQAASQIGAPQSITDQLVKQYG